MKLSKDIIEKIDSFFNKITPDELFDLSINKYGFVEIIDIKINELSFGTISELYYYSDSDNSFDTEIIENLPLAA